MIRDHADEYEEADALLNESLSEAEPDDMPFASDDELRRTRITEYQHEALRMSDPLRANLGALNAGLLGIALQYETVVKNSLQAAGGNILENPQLQRAITTHLNIARQVDRFANLEVRLEADEQRADDAKCQRRIAVMPARAEAKFR